MQLPPLHCRLVTVNPFRLSTKAGFFYICRNSHTHFRWTHKENMLWFYSVKCGTRFTIAEAVKVSTYPGVYLDRRQMRSVSVLPPPAPDWKCTQAITLPSTRRSCLLRHTVPACNSLAIETSARKENNYKKSWHWLVGQYGQTAVARQHKKTTQHQLLTKIMIWWHIKIRLY